MITSRTSVDRSPKNGPALSSEDVHLKVIDETELIVYRDTDGKIDETEVDI